VINVYLFEYTLFAVGDFCIGAAVTWFPAPSSHLAEAIARPFAYDTGKGRANYTVVCNRVILHIETCFDMPRWSYHRGKHKQGNESQENEEPGFPHSAPPNVRKTTRHDIPNYLDCQQQWSRQDRQKLLDILRTNPESYEIEYYKIFAGR
jgi:hypothetical protein